MKGEVIAETPKDEHLKEAVKRLAELEPMDYEGQREEEAKKLKCRVSKLDEFVQSQRPISEGAEDSKSGSAVTFEDCKQWDTEIIGPEALDDALSNISRHMHINPHYADVCVLWAAHTHLFKQLSHTPRLLISAPEPNCGKTLLLFHMLGSLSNKSMPVDRMSSAVFCRLSEAQQCTFLIDEGDTFLNQDSDLIGKRPANTVTPPT